MNEKWGTKDWFNKKLKENGKININYFDYGKSAYQQSRIDEIKKFVEDALRDGHLNSPRNYIDIGSATGELTLEMKNILKPLSTVGYDQSELVVAEANKRHPAIEFKVENIENIVLNNREEQIITMFEVIYYTEKQKRIEILKRLVGQMSDQSSIIISSNIMGGYYMTLAEMRQIIKDAKLEIIKLEYLNFKKYITIQKYLFMMQRLLIRVAKSKIEKQDGHIGAVIEKILNLTNRSIMSYALVNLCEKLNAVYKSQPSHAIILLRKMK